MNPTKAIRSALSVLAGYVLFAVSAFLIFRLFNRPPHQIAPLWFMVLATVVGVLGAGAGGYVSGVLAGSGPVGHAFGVAGVLVLGASTSLSATIGKGAIWSQVAAITLMAPSAVVGGWIRRRHGNLA